MTQRGVGRIAVQTRLSFIGFLIVSGLITGSALADRVFGLGWGYGQWDAVWGVGIMLWGCFVYFLCTRIFRLLQ